jgi:multiple sugar transport system substrate-binding protein
MNNTWRRIGLGVLAIVIVTTVACSKNDSVLDETAQTIRIAVMQSYGNYDRSMYTELYEITHPKTKVEIVSAVDYNKIDQESGITPDYVAEMKKLLTGDNPPDIVIANSLDEFRKLTEENVLTPLDAFMKKDNVDTSAFVPSLLEGLKTVASDGQLYGLAPLFSTSALYFNRGIFEQAGIDPPRDGMTWDEVLKLAEQVASGNGKERTYGISFDSWWPSNVMANAQKFARQLKLRFFDDNLERMEINRPEWENVFSTIVSLHKNKVVLDETTAQSDQGQYYDYNDNIFTRGKLAMMIGDISLIDTIISGNERIQNTGKGDPIDWDVVTMPTFPEAPNIGSALFVSGLMGINAKAQNADGAWDFIRFINSKEWARIKSRSESYLSSLTEFVKPKEGYEYNVGAFYKLTPIAGNENTITFPNIDQIGQTQLDEVLKGKMKLKDALKKWDEEGNKLLVQERENAKKKKQADQESNQ